MMSRQKQGLWLAATLTICSMVSPRISDTAPPEPRTFSIVAADPEAGEVGVAVANRFFAVGTVVPWAKAAE